MKKAQPSITIKNKKAYFEYFIIDKYKAGIVLTGTEIKSIREGKVNITDAYCMFIENELFIKNMHISEYKLGTYSNHDPKRDRKLMLTRKELNKLKAKVKEKSMTIVPLTLFINEKGLAKIEIATAKGKRLYDKRETMKIKDLNRQMAI